MKVVIATGGFDPLHSGHIEYLKCAAALGDVLIVGLNSDDWLKRKKGRYFMPFYEREKVVSNLAFVHNVIAFDDWDDTAIECILKVKRFYPKADIVFANGGDRDEGNIPEHKYFKSDDWIEFNYGVGGTEKRNSSSSILEKWVSNQTERPWGYYRVIHNELNVVKVKELVVMPGEKLSMQRHNNRAEHWFITKGVATVYTLNDNGDNELDGEYKMFDTLHIPKGDWHMLANEEHVPLKIVEIQYGTDCSEDDIERKNA
jgi:cytidyltransferase-like protein